MKLIKSILALAATVFLGVSAMAVDEVATDSKIHLAYVDGHADKAVIHNHYHASDYDGYNYRSKLKSGSGVSLSTRTEESTVTGIGARNNHVYDAYTTMTATESGASPVILIQRAKSNSTAEGNYKDVYSPKGDANPGFDVVTEGKRSLLVGETKNYYCFFQISQKDATVTSAGSGSWEDPVTSEGVEASNNYNPNSYAHNTLSVKGKAIGWQTVEVKCATDGGPDGRWPEDTTYTLNFQVRDRPVVSGGNPDRQIAFNTKLSTVDLSDVEMVDSKGDAVQGDFEWDNPDKTWSERTTTTEQAIFRATGENAEFYDPVSVDVTIVVGDPKFPVIGTFGDPIAPGDGSRTLSDCAGWAWKTAKVVGDDLGGVTVTAAPAQTGDLPVVNVGNATRGGKVTIWVEDDEMIRIYEGVVYQEKAKDVMGYKNSTQHVTFAADVAGVWTAQSDDESVATVTVPSDETAEVVAAITCKDKGATTLTIKNDYIVYTVTVNVDSEKEAVPGKFNLAPHEKVEMSLYQIDNGNPVAWNFRVNKSGNGIDISRDGGENRSQNTLVVSFVPLTEDGTAEASILQHEGNEASATWYDYTSLKYISAAEAMPKRIMYLGDTKQLYLLSSEAAAWTVVPADDGVVSVKAPVGAVEEGYAQVTGEKVGTTTFTIGNTAETSSGSGFFKGVTYTIDYEVRGMPVADGALTGDANLEPGAALSTIGVAGTMKDEKGNKVEGKFAWVNDTQTFDEPGTETVEAIFKPANSSYDSVKVKVIVTVKSKVITISIVADEDESNIAAVNYDGDNYANDDLELSADTTEVELTLEASDDLAFPVYKVVRDNVTNVTTKVATYAIKDGDELKFFAEEGGVPVGEKAFARITDGVCTIGGEGAATAFPDGFDRSSVTSVAVEDGITEIGKLFFKKCTNMKSMTFGKDVVAFGERAFHQCFALEEINLANEDALDSLKNAVNYRLMYDADGNFVVAPKVNVEGYVEMLFGKEKLTDADWTEIGKLFGENLETLKKEGKWHFFQTRLVKTVESN